MNLAIRTLQTTRETDLTTRPPLTPRYGRSDSRLILLSTCHPMFALYRRQTLLYYSDLTGPGGRFTRERSRCP
jgi:hypothetical protein